MSFIATLEAELGVAFARNFPNISKDVTALAAQITIFVGAPSHIFIIICEILAEPLEVVIFDSRVASEKSLEEGVRHP